MNSVSNSDSERCPESNLGWVHRVHTQRTLAARTHSAQAVSWGTLVPCHGRALTVSQPVVGLVVAVSQVCHCAHARSSAPCRSSPRSRYKFVSQHNSLLRAMLRMHSAVSWRILRRIATCIAAPIATQIPPQATIQSLYRDTLPIQAIRARALPHAPRAGWPYRGPLMAVL